MALSWILNILLFYAILVVVNILAPFLGLKFDSGPEPRLSYAPPGFIIPVVWFGLFALLGIARYYLIQSGHKSFQWWLYGLAFLCAAYACYTLGLSQLTRVSALWFGLIENIAVIIFAAFVVYKLFPVNKTAAYLTIPVIIWTAFASIIVLGEMRLDKLI
ncbi:MAG: TspO/MBR family protein [Chitinophagaceae bacterium]